MLTDKIRLTLRAKEADRGRICKHDGAVDHDTYAIGQMFHQFLVILPTVLKFGLYLYSLGDIPDNIGISIPTRRRLSDLSDRPG